MSFPPRPRSWIRKSPEAEAEAGDTAVVVESRAGVEPPGGVEPPVVEAAKGAERAARAELAVAPVVKGLERLLRSTGRLLQLSSTATTTTRAAFFRSCPYPWPKTSKYCKALPKAPAALRSITPTICSAVWI